MKYKILLSILLITSIFISCNDGDNTVDLTRDDSKFLAMLDDDPAALKLVELSSGKTLINDVYSDANDEKLPAAIEDIEKYGNSLYLMIPEANKIVIINKETYKKVQEIDFSAEGLQPSGICFPNATTAFISHQNSNILHVLDLTNNVLAGTVEAGNSGVAIDCSGNQVYVVNQADNTVSVIDTRTNAEEAVISVKEAPTFLEITPDGKRALVISLGGGKIDENQKTNAILTIIDIATRSIEREVEIGNSAVSAVDQEPVSMSITSDEYVFVQTKDYLFNLNIEYGSQMYMVNPASYIDLEYHPFTGRLLMLSPGQIVHANNETGKTIKTVNVDNNIEKIFLL